MEFKHVSVLLEESIKGLNIKKDGIYVDGTMGGAGHSIEICKRLNNEGRFIGIDQDKKAIEAAKEKLKEYKKIEIVRENFVNIDKVLDNLEIDKIDGMLLDLGVSSYQLDEAERGFSYRYDAELDMRMDRRQSLTAKDVVNKYSQEKLTKIFYEYGEEDWGKRIAEFIVEFREEEEIKTTFDLINIIKKAIPKNVRMGGKHPARKTFQALRIEVNNELKIIDKTIKKVVKRLNKGGRLCIITFHSLEDRIVKNTFRFLNKDCICSKKLPICICDKESEVKIITNKPIEPTDEEKEDNRRSRSAKLRIIEKK